MKKSFTVFYFIIFFSISKYSYANINKIVIKVENEIITSYEIKIVFDFIKFSGTEVTQKNINQLKKQAVES